MYENRIYNLKVSPEIWVTAKQDSRGESKPILNDEVKHSKAVNSWNKICKNTEAPSSRFKKNR